MNTLSGKYIITNTLGHEVPILFSCLLSHADIGSGIIVISAGFFQIGNETIMAYGKSTILNISSRKEDANIIEKGLNKLL